MTESTCAVWYWRHGAPDVELFDDEADAVAYAVNATDNGQAVISGIQFADGRFLTRDAWPAYDALVRRREAEEAATRRAPLEPTRAVKSPFDTWVTVRVPHDAPDWLGHRP